MTPKLKSLFILLVVIAGTSLTTNGFLAWQWQVERQQWRTLVASQTDTLRIRAARNKELTQENVGFQADLVAKDKELAAKIEELTKKQAELKTLTDQLDAKRAELDTKAKQLEAKNAELTQAQKQIDDQKSQLSSNSDELAKLRNRPPLFSFVVKSTDQTNIEQQKEDVKALVTAAYDVIREVMGEPYNLRNVTITFVDQFSNPKANGEIVISNANGNFSIDIRLKKFDKNSFDDTNTVIHEIVHAFRGLASLDPAPFEEGSAVAVTDVVMAKLIAAGRMKNFSPLYIRLSEAEYAQKQATLSIPRSTSAFYGSDDVADYYQVLGKAWYKLWQQDSEFFKKFNDKLYARKNQGQDITEAMVLEIIREVLPSAQLTGAAWELK